MSTKNEELIAEYRETLASYQGGGQYADRDAVRVGFADDLADALEAATKPVTRRDIEIAIGYDPVPLSIDGHPEIRWTHRTVTDRDGIVDKIMAMLENHG